MRVCVPKNRGPPPFHICAFVLWLAVEAQRKGSQRRDRTESKLETSIRLHELQKLGLGVRLQKATLLGAGPLGPSLTALWLFAL